MELAFSSRFYKRLLLITFLIFLVTSRLPGQNLYTARGYWEESSKVPYSSIKKKKENGQSLSPEEETYVQDYEAFLFTYYNRLSEGAKQEFERMKDQWDRELSMPQVSTELSKEQLSSEQTEFEWRGRDRFINALYGIYYGASVSAVFGLEDAAAAGVPLVTGGLWMLGPVFNPKKYEGITESTMRASNTGKILGLIYGASFGLALAGEGDNSEKVVLGLSTLGSIALGEIAFQTQKRKNISGGKIEIMRHYGFLGTGVGGALLASTDTDNAHLVGVGLLAGGISGLLIGKKVANRYDYTRGDVDALSALGVISTGLGFALIANALENNTDISNAIFLVPASTAVAGTLIGQKQVRNAYLTKKQGSTINLSTAGGALLGLGVMTLTQGDSPTAWIAVPSTCALIAHQIVFNRYKRDNVVNNLKGENGRKKNYSFSMKLMPENYFVNKNTPQRFIADPRLAANTPLVNMTLKFK